MAKEADANLIVPMRSDHSAKALGNSKFTCRMMFFFLFFLKLLPTQQWLNCFSNNFLYSVYSLQNSNYSLGKFSTVGDTSGAKIFFVKSAVENPHCSCGLRASM